MSMYKTIFVTEETDLQSGEQVFTINGEVSLYGESAFSNLEEAVAAVAQNEQYAVIRVQSGKYDGFVVVNDHSASEAAKVVAVDFNGGTVDSSTGDVVVEAANFSAAEQAAIISDLNDANAADGIVYVADSAAADVTLLVSNGDAAIAGSVVYGDSVSDIVDVITNSNKVDLLAGNDVAFIGETGYETVKAALGAAKDGDTITLKEGLSGSAEGKVELDFSLEGATTITGNAPEYALPIVTVEDADGVADGTRTVLNIDNANILTAELDVRKEATINVNDSTVADFGGDSIVKSYFDGAININGNSSVESMQTTTTGYITLNDNATAMNTWQTNIMDNGLLTVNDDAVFTTAGLKIGENYDRDNTDADRVGAPATILVNGGTFKTLDYNHAYYYNTNQAVIGKDHAGLIKVTNGGTAALNHEDGVLVNANGTIELNGGTVSVDAKNGSEVLTNNGYIQISANNSTLDAVVQGNGTLDIFNGASFTNSKDLSAKLIYVGRNSKTSVDSGAEFTVAEGTTVKGGDAIYVREDSAMIVNGKVVAGQYYLKDDVTVNEGGEMVMGGVEGVVVKDGAVLTISGDAYTDVKATEPNKIIVDVQSGSKVVLAGGSLDTTSEKFGSDDTNGIKVAAGAFFEITGDSSLKATTVTNNGTFTVGGESTLNIAAVAAGSNDIELSEGTILKDSTIMGDVGITGNVTFRGKNVLNNLYDFGKYGAYGNTDWAKWTVEAGSQLFLEQSVTGLGNNLYGVGYGDTVVINGNLTDADAARAAGLTKDDASFYSRTGVRFSSGAGWATSSFTVNNAYVILGTEDGSFSNSAKNGGAHEITFNNAVVDAAQFYFSESSATFDMSITDSNINATIFMTADTDSVYTLTGSKVVTTGSGNDRYNGNAGALTITDSEITVQTGSYKNSGTITFTDSTLTAASVVNNGTINLSVSAEKLASVTKDAYVIVEQTANGGMVTDGMTVSVAGTDRLVGATWEDKGVTYSLTNGDGNDIILKAQANVLTVDASFTEETAGYGFTKFSSFTSALEQAAKGNIEEIVVNGDISEAMPTDIFFVVNNDVKITADQASNIRLTNDGTNYDIVLGSDNGSKIIIDKNVSLKLNDRVIWVGHSYYAKGADIEINGIVESNQWWNGGNTTVNVGGKLISSGEALVMRNGSTLKVIGDAVQGTASADRVTQLDANYFSFLSGNLIASNTKIESGPLWVSNTGGYAYEGEAFIEIDNTVWENSSNFKLNSDKTAQFNVLNGSTATFGSVHGASEIGANGILNISDSTFTAPSIINNGEFTVTGDSTLNLNKMSSTKTVTLGGAEDRSTLSLGSVSGNGASIDASRLNIYKADVTLTDDVSVGAPTNVLHKIQDSTIDMGENTLSYKGFTVLDSYSGKSYLGSNEGVTLKNGEFKVTDSGHLCFQGYDHVIAEDAVVNFDGSNYKVFAKYDKQGNPEYNTTTMVNVYGSLTVKGKLNVTHNTETNHGYDNVGTTDTGWGKEKYPESVLTVSGENAAYTIENGHMFRVYHETDATGAGTLNVENGAAFSFTGSRNGTGLFYNSNIVNVDADSTFTVDTYYGHAENNAAKMGSFNSTTAGEMIVLGNVTVNKTLTTDSLVINQGAALSAGSITVDNLTLEIGGSLTLTGTGSTVAADYITVTGELNPENAEFTLVTSGWNSDFAKSISFGGVTYTWNGTDKYFDGTSLEQGEFYFTVDGGKLYVAKQTAEIGGIYIGNIDNKSDGDKITVDGVTYTVGKDAFADADTAATAAENDPALKDNVTQLAIDADYASDEDKLSTLKESFVNLKEITVSENGKLEDTSTTAVAFADGLTLNNEGHFIANVEVSGDFIFTNASPNTLGGNYMVDGNMSGTNFDNGAMFGDYNVTGNIDLINLGTLGDTANSTTLTADGSISITGGKTAAAIKVNTDMLYLTDTESFNVDAANSSVITSGEGYIALDGSANLSIDGDNNSIDTEIYAATDHTGTLTLNGDQTYGDAAALSAKKIVIAAGKNVTINGLADSNELEIAGTLNTAFDDMSNFTSAGDVTGTGTLNTTHTGDWVVNDSVSRNFSGFTGTVSMGDANASIVLGKGDIVSGAAAKESYFSDNATVTVNGTQSVVLAGDGVNTGIDFDGTGVLKVGDYDDKDQSEDFTQTLSGDNTGFTGTVNVEEGAVLKIESALGASKINLNAEAVQSAENTSDELLDTQLVLNSNGLSLSAKITGDADDIIDVKKNATLSETGALNGFKGTIELDANKLTLVANETAATVKGEAGSVVDANGNLSLTTENAIKDFKGTIELEGNTLTLGAANTTSATVKGSGVIDADANQVFTGDVTGFTGNFDIATTAEVKLSGTFADTINAQGGTLTLANAAGKAVTVNGGTGLNTLKFGNNTLTLGTGLFTNVNGTGSVKFADTHTDNVFTSLVAKDVTLTGGRNITATDFDGNLHITISVADDGTADLTTNSTFGDTIYVTINNSALLTGNDYNVIKAAGGYGSINSIELTIGSETKTLYLNDSVKLDGYTYSLRDKDGVWVIDQRAGASNIVVVNAIWTADPYAAVMDGTTGRIIGYDAAQTLDDAVAYIRGYSEGQGWEAVTGAGKIELTAGKYTLTDGKYLMTTGNDGNGVTKMTLAARDGEKASVTGVLRGSNGSAATTLTVENVQLINNVFAGGKLVINNSNAAKTTSAVLAAGVDKDSTNGSALEINGGTFSSRYVVGGSYNSTADTTITVNGNTSVSIKNATIVGHIYGGSYAAKGTVDQTGNALVTIDASSAVSLRGNIYVSGYAATGATLNLNGDSIATFTGNAANLTFTGSVNATQSAKDEIVVFKDFSGTFNGSLNGFDTITISGDTNLELGRRQTKTAETDLKFVVDNTTVTSDGAMYTVRDKNRWEFSNDIFVTTKYAESGSYVLINNYAGDFSNFSFNLNGTDYTLGTSVVNGEESTVINVNDKGQLVLDYTAPTNITKAEIADGDEAIFTNKTLEADANSGNAMTFGGYNDAVSANVALNGTTVNGNIHTGWYGDLAFETTGTTVINGSIDGHANLVDLTVSGTTTITGAFDSGSGADKVVINDNASLEVNVVSTGNNNDLIQLGEGAEMQVSGMIASYPGDDRSLDTGNGDDTVVIGKDANVSIAGEIAFGNQNDTLVLETGASLSAGEINGGIDTDTFNMKKGSSVTCVSATMFEKYNLDVDAILNNSSAMYGVNVNVSGVAALSSDVAGATAVIGKVGSVGSLTIDDVDVVLDTATQIAGTATAADTTDDVWASLNKVGSSLVVAWGRNETELDAALDAFKADSTLTLGQAVVADAASLADNGVSVADFKDKKDNGQLA